MKLSEAIAAMENGKRVVNSKGTDFWIAHDDKGCPVLMTIPGNYRKEVRHAVFSSEHFDQAVTWAISGEGV